jgi:predicted transposase YdaD
MRESVIYQEILQEGETRGKIEGKLEGELALVLKLLSRRVGSIPSNAQAQIQALSLPQIEALSEVLLDFSTPDDLIYLVTRQLGLKRATGR